ncbi:uncharacterized protein LOC116168082 [Photinus pyralis]|uniref:uncharacterized protein LOC116168082 n=1 Tax=Photinus pyralis TaxID=7054 RepID=UPI0012670531|nr:uncharacterized protein LOC116168082 [Photinus pyralis]
MARVVLMWLISSIVLKWVMCFETDRKNVTQVCLKHVIEEMFGTNETIHFLVPEDFAYHSIYEVPNPKIVVTINSEIHEIPSNAGRNFVIHAENWYSLELALEYLNHSSIWNGTWSPVGKFLLFTNEKNASVLFQTLWRYKLVRSVVVLSEESNPVPELYTSNPYIEGNQCGANPTKFDIQSCAVRPRLRDAIKPILTSYGACEVEYQLRSPKESDLRIEWREYAELVVDFLKERMNVSIVGYPPSLRYPLNIRIRFYATNRWPYNISPYQETRVTVTENFIWLVPKPDQISPLKVYFIVFKYSVWILIISCLLLISVLWWVTFGFSSSFSRPLLNVFSITLWGSYASVPNVKPLKLLLLLYIIYSIHIQTAYVSLLYKLLTIPQYGKGIETLPELADSRLTIYSQPRLIRAYMYQNISDYALYTRIQSQLEKNHVKASNPLKPGDNYASLITETTFKQFQVNSKTIMTNKIIDNCLTGPVEYAFMTLRGHYFKETLNHIIIGLAESGLAEKLRRDVNYFNEKNLLKFEKNYDAKPLTLGQLYGIFVICGTLLALSMVVFCIEVAVGKRMKQRQIEYRN